jgi:hypothetical protein
MVVPGIPMEGPVSRILRDAEVDVAVDYHQFGLVDSAAVENRPPPGQGGPRWLRVGRSLVFFESEGPLVGARVRFEAWDGPAPFDEAQWPMSEVVMLDMPSGRIGTDEITYGAQSDVFILPAPGRYRVRVAWREGEFDPRRGGEGPEAFALAQFWPAEPG